MKQTELSDQILYKDWLHLNVILLWCHERLITTHRMQESCNPPLSWRDKTYSGAWLIYEGWAETEIGGECVRAESGQWLVLKPSQRVQRIAHGTKLLSVVFEARWPQGEPLFNGGLSAVLSGADYPDLERRARAILRATKPMNPQSFDIRRCPANVGIYFELHQRLMAWLATLTNALAEVGVEPMVPTAMDPRVAHAVRLLNAHPLDDHSFRATDLAMMVGVSPQYLTRLFHRHLDMTPTDFLSRRRFDAACRSLRMNGARIKAVAHEMGFRHLSHFSKWFVGHAGCTPRAFCEGIDDSPSARV